MKRSGEIQRKTPLKAKTPLRAKSGLSTRVGIARRKAQSAKRAKTGPKREVVDLVFARDGGRCVRCGASQGFRSTHHRRPRRAGGSRAPETNLPANLITLCGTGTTGCHGWIEANRAAAYAGGWLLRAAETPSAVPVETWWGWVYLDDAGRWTEVPS